ncbi:MAG: hypothetical protein ACLFQ0_16985 [Cyclobacteriaceae bacterium]
MKNSGKWIGHRDGSKVWVLKIKSEDALSINFIFNQFDIPKGAEVYIYNDSKTDIQGPLNHMFNKNGGRYANAPVQGEAIIIEYYQPADQKETGNIEISTVVHGFKNLQSLSGLPSGNFGGSAPCNRDIKCESSWSREANAVAMVYHGGIYRGTGALINNTDQDWHPYFITANHILVGSVADITVFAFKYWSPSCGGGNGNTNTYVTGFTYNALFQDTRLITLDESPATVWLSDDWTYLGWSVINSIPSTVTNILQYRM